MTGGESLNIKGSTISHMTAVHPGHWLPVALHKEGSVVQNISVIQVGLCCRGFGRQSKHCPTNKSCFLSDIILTTIDPAAHYLVLMTMVQQS